MARNIRGNRKNVRSYPYILFPSIGKCYFSEILHEDKGFPERHLAGLVASKVYFHLGSFEDSLTYALGAGDLFDVNARTEYVETTLGNFPTHLLYQLKLIYTNFSS